MTSSSKHEGFETVILKANGKLVHKETIPRFRPRAQVIVWGQRFFRLLGPGVPVVPVYEEAFTYWIPEPPIEVPENYVYGPGGK